MDKSLASEEVRRLVRLGLLPEQGRIHALLIYLIDKTFDGTAGALKAYAIALDVFDRDADFDPVSNSLVRVEMHRLRTILDQYAKSPPDDARIIMSIPKGGYEVLFLDAAHAAKEKPAKTRKLHVFALVITLFTLGLSLFYVYRTLQEDTCQSERPRIVVESDNSGGVGTEFQNLFYKYLEYYPLVAAETDATRKCNGAPSFIITMHEEPTEIHVSIARSEKRQAVIWERTFANAESPLFDWVDLSAAQLAYEIGFSNGVIPSSALGSVWNDAPSRLEYACLMSGHRLFLTVPGPESATVRDCLRKYAFTSPHADLVALYAVIEMYSVQFKAPMGFEADEKLAMKAFARAENLDPINSELLIGKLRMLRREMPKDLLARANQLVRARGLMERMRREYPMEPHVLHQISILQGGTLDQPDEALLTHAEARTIAPNAYIHWGMIYANIAKRDWAALQESRHVLKESSYDWELALVLSKLALVVEGDQQKSDEYLRFLATRHKIRTADDVAQRAKDLPFGDMVIKSIKDLGQELLPAH